MVAVAAQVRLADCNPVGARRVALGGRAVSEPGRCGFSLLYAAAEYMPWSFLRGGSGAAVAAAVAQAYIIQSSFLAFTGTNPH